MSGYGLYGDDPSDDYGQAQAEADYWAEQHALAAVDDYEMQLEREAETDAMDE